MACQLKIVAGTFELTDGLTASDLFLQFDRSSGPTNMDFKMCLTMRSPI